MDNTYIVCNVAGCFASAYALCRLEYANTREGVRVSVRLSNVEMCEIWLDMDYPAASVVASGYCGCGYYGMVTQSLLLSIAYTHSQS